ncbi:MAG: PilZ domain-containing protein [Magnetospirillum sp.]|nr:PilZ domain-containing protein [Magnetospirillum sp.]
MAIGSSRNDRRFDDRHPGTGLICRIGDVEMDVLDISIGGMKIPPIPGRNTFIKNKLDFILISTHWPEMRPAAGQGEVRAANRTWLALQFERPTYDLMKCVSRHVGTLLWGGKPYGY